MATELHEIGYRPHVTDIEIMTMPPRTDIFGAFAFDAVFTNTRRMVSPDPDHEPILNTRLAAASLEAARAYALHINPAIFPQEHKKLRLAGFSTVQNVFADENMVLEIIGDENSQGVTADFVIELASCEEDKEALVEAITNATSETPDQALLAFRDLLLEPELDSGSRTDPTPDASIKSKHELTLGEIISQVLNEFEACNFTAHEPAQRIIEAFSEIKRDLTRLKRVRGSDGRMEIAVNEAIELLIAKRARALNELPKTQKQLVKNEMKNRQIERERRAGGNS